MNIFSTLFKCDPSSHYECNHFYRDLDRYKRYIKELCEDDTLSDELVNKYINKHTSTLNKTLVLQAISINQDNSTIINKPIISEGDKRVYVYNINYYKNYIKANSNKDDIDNALIDTLILLHDKELDKIKNQYKKQSNELIATKTKVTAKKEIKEHPKTNIKLEQTSLDSNKDNYLNNPILSVATSRKRDELPKINNADPGIKCFIKRHINIPVCEDIIEELSMCFQKVYQQTLTERMLDRAIVEYKLNRKDTFSNRIEEEKIKYYINFIKTSKPNLNDPSIDIKKLAFYLLKMHWEQLNMSLLLRAANEYGTNRRKQSETEQRS